MPRTRPRRARGADCRCLHVVGLDSLLGGGGGGGGGGQDGSSHGCSGVLFTLCFRCWKMIRLC